MISFVIPLTSAQRSDNWTLTSRLFARTLQSVLAQTDPSFHVVVVGHDVPDVPQLADRRVHVKLVDFATTLSPRDPRFHADDHTETGETDKGRKLLFGTQVSRELGSSHIMFVDADDCISRRIAAIANLHPAAPGWKIERGYEYAEPGPSVRYKPWRFHRQCGTGLIVRHDLLPNPENPEYDRGLRYYRAFLGHDHLADDLEATGHRLATLPFSGAVYVLHSQNMRAHEWIASRSWWRQRAASARGLLLSRRLTDPIREEFQLNPLEDSPPQPPGGGSGCSDAAERAKRTAHS